jgi:hypothetical protein
VNKLSPGTRRKNNERARLSVECLREGNFNTVEEEKINVDVLGRIPCPESFCVLVLLGLLREEREKVFPSKDVAEIHLVAGVKIAPGVKYIALELKWPF